MNNKKIISAVIVGLSIVTLNSSFNKKNGSISANSISSSISLAAINNVNANNCTTQVTLLDNIVVNGQKYKSISTNLDYPKFENIKVVPDTITTINIPVNYKIEPLSNNESITQSDVDNYVKNDGSIIEGQLLIQSSNGNKKYIAKSKVNISNGQTTLQFKIDSNELINSKGNVIVFDGDLSNSKVNSPIYRKNVLSFIATKESSSSSLVKSSSTKESNSSSLATKSSSIKENSSSSLVKSSSIKENSSSNLVKSNLIKGNNDSNSFKLSSSKKDKNTANKIKSLPNTGESYNLLSLLGISMIASSILLLKAKKK